MTALLALGFGYYTLATLFVIICLLLVLMVTITPSQEGGMAAAFGGLGSDSFFGTKAHQQINKFTVFLAISFLVLAIALNSIKANEVESHKAGKNEPTELEKKVQEKMPPQNPSGLPDPSTLPPPPPPKK